MLLYIITKRKTSKLKIMTTLSSQIEIKRNLESEIVSVLGKNYFVKSVKFEDRVEPTVVLEHFQNSEAKVQFRLEWFLENHKIIELC